LIDKVLVENERNTLIKTRMKAFGGVLTTRGDYVINEDADNGPWAWTVSLGAFKDLSEAFEQDQAESIFPGETAFSEEDLPSNLIGFYIALYEHQGIFTNPNPKISEAERAFVERVCGCLDGQDSLRAFELYEEANAWREVRDWRDAHVDFDDGCEIASMCNGIPRSWPALLNTLPPIPKSRLLGFFWEYDWSVDGLVGRWIQEDVWELEDNG
jgi:hypothetical protein